MERQEKEGWLVELIGDQSPSPEAPPRSKRGGSKGDLHNQSRCQAKKGRR